MSDPRNAVESGAPEVKGVREALEKAADTFADAAKTFAMFQKPLAATAMQLAEKGCRDALRAAQPAPAYHCKECGKPAGAAHATWCKQRLLSSAINPIVMQPAAPPVAADAARPVAWMKGNCDDFTSGSLVADAWGHLGHKVTPLYAAAPVAAPPVRWCPDCEEAVGPEHHIAPSEPTKEQIAAVRGALAADQIHDLSVGTIKALIRAVFAAPAHEAAPPASVALLKEARSRLGTLIRDLNSSLDAARDGRHHFNITDGDEVMAELRLIDAKLDAALLGEDK